MERKRSEKQPSTKKKMRKKKCHIFLKEFKKMAPYDGIIIYPSNNCDEIIKVKPFNLLTVDLQYDDNLIFLDSDSNCYVLYFYRVDEIRD